MSLWLEVSFLKQIGYRLDGFKVKKEGQSHLYNCRCYSCGDSSKKKNKKRGYFYDHEGHLFYKCWNCGLSQTFSQFLKAFDPALHKVFRLDLYKEKVGRDVEDATPPNDDLLKTKISDILVRASEQEFFNNCVKVLDLPKEHKAYQYIINRKIPEEHLDMFWYTEKFFTWASKNTDKFTVGEHTSDLQDHPRIIIPWYSENKELFAYQARSLNGEEPKYYTIILNEKIPKVFGADRLDFKGKKIYVLEGPIDSLFLPNAVAVGSSALTNFDDKDLNVTYCFDNEKRNAQIVAAMTKAAKKGKTLFIPPDNYKWKDINDAVEKGNLTQKEILDMITENTFTGLAAVVRLNKWRRS
jgi:hypothetical protein